MQFLRPFPGKFRFLQGDFHLFLIGNSLGNFCFCLKDPRLCVFLLRLRLFQLGFRLFLLRLRLLQLCLSLFQLGVGRLKFRLIQRIIDPGKDHTRLDFRAVIDRISIHIRAESGDHAAHLGTNVHQFLRLHRSRSGNGQFQIRPGGFLKDELRFLFIRKNFLVQHIPADCDHSKPRDITSDFFPIHTFTPCLFFYFDFLNKHSIYNAIFSLFIARIRLFLKKIHYKG